MMFDIVMNASGVLHIDGMFSSQRAYSAHVKRLLEIGCVEMCSGRSKGRCQGICRPAIVSVGSKQTVKLHVNQNAASLGLVGPDGDNHGVCKTRKSPSSFCNKTDMIAYDCPGESDRRELDGLNKSAAIRHCLLR
jgi:hypothetical protein